MNRIIKIWVLILVTVASQSCEEYLSEDFRSGNPTDAFYATADGLESLVGAAYMTSRIWYGQEEGIDFTDIGTDLYSFGPEHPNPEQFLYTRAFDSQRGRLIALWVELYKGINACNEAFAYTEKADHPLDEATRILRSAEVRYLRAFYMWHLVETFGPIPMPLEYTQGPVTTATRVPVYDVYNQIFQDLDFANGILSASDNSGDNNFGRVTKDAVLAFRARLSLNVASYINSGDEFGFAAGLPVGGNNLTSASDFYAQAKTDADAVINSSSHSYSFYDDYTDLWDLGNNSANWNSEGIWAINFSRNSSSLMGVPNSDYDVYYLNGQKPWSDREGGDVRHLMFGMRYDVLPGMHRDLLNGRPFRRYFPLKHFVDLYDDNDTRWEEQFQLAYIANDDTTGLSPDKMTFPAWEDFDLPAGFTIPDKYAYTDPKLGLRHHVYRTGDTAVFLTKADIPESEIAPGLETTSRKGLNVSLTHHCLIWDQTLEYDVNNPNANGAIPINQVGTLTREYFYKLKKFDDPERVAANGTGSERGIRDVYVFRLAEMYLIAAEAIAVGGVSGDARAYLNEMANSRAKDGNGAALVDAGIASSKNGALDIYYFLDERGREFPGEQMRWFELKRAFNRTQWVDYIHSVNADTEELQAFHYFRPIPQIQLDAISNRFDENTNPDGFKQNDGYN